MSIEETPESELSAEGPEGGASPLIGALTRKPFGGKRRLHNVVRLRFKSSFISHTYDARLLELRQRDQVIVETSKGPALATIASEVYRAVMPRGSLKRVLRKASRKDLERDASNKQREKEAFLFALERVRHRKLDMKLIQVHCMHDGSKIVFYFSADGRIDFRNLVKDLAYRFRTRIEMRQIGARDGARMIGGIGSCGRELCCSTFLENFAPVSIRMAKEQGLTLNPKKVSGMCGRLMCCLVYEQQIYHRTRKRLPRINKPVLTAEGVGKIRSVDVVQEKLVVLLDDGRLEPFAVAEVVALTAREAEQHRARIAQGGNSRGDRRSKGGRRGAERASQEAAQVEDGRASADPFKSALEDALTGEDEYLWEQPGKSGDGAEKEKDQPSVRRRRRRRRGGRGGQADEGGASAQGAGSASVDKTAAGEQKGAGRSAKGKPEASGGGDGRKRGRRRGDGRGRGRGEAGAGQKSPSGEAKAPRDERSPRADGESSGGGGDKPRRSRRRRRRRGGGGNKEGGSGGGEGTSSDHSS